MVMSFLWYKEHRLSIYIVLSAKKYCSKNNIRPNDSSCLLNIRLLIIETIANFYVLSFIM